MTPGEVGARDRRATPYSGEPSVLFGILILTRSLCTPFGTGRYGDSY